MKKINQNLYPKDGYRFKDSDGATIYGDSWAGVIARVANYRKRAGYPPGNPAEEVIAQACANQPGYCSEADARTVEQLKAVSLKTRVLKWFSSLRASKNELTFTSWETQRARANICATCPRNTPLPGGCASCAAIVKELRKEMVGDRPIDGRLNACSELGEDPAVSSYFELQAVENPALPPQCWRKRTL
jgi:hypothetical protein